MTLLALYAIALSDTDGDTDVVAVSLTSNSLVWYENQGASGTPTAVAWVQHPIASVPLAHRVAGAQANADNHIDILFEGDSGPAFFINVPGSPLSWTLNTFYYNPSVISSFPVDIGESAVSVCGCLGTFQVWVVHGAPTVQIA